MEKRALRLKGINRERKKTSKAWNEKGGILDNTYPRAFERGEKRVMFSHPKDKRRRGGSMFP